jgi:peptide chain release factor 3
VTSGGGYAPDWMAVERGVSVSSAVMSFEHEGPRLQPARHTAHQDFSEDAYRTLKSTAR